MPLTIQLNLTDVAGAAMANAAVYVWHCDQAGRYSLYDIEDQNYLHGVQVSDASGKVSFTSIFPAAYSGRWPHIHFEVVANMSRTTPVNDNVFSDDGGVEQLATMTGTVACGLTAALTVPVA